MNESSERRGAAGSIGEGLGNSSGWAEREWGELKMIGARQPAGSTISNGGDNSPSNWVIRRAPSLSCAILLSGSFLPENRVFCEAILSEIAGPLPSEK